MSREGYSDQATHGSNSSAQRRNDYPRYTHDGAARRTQLGSQTNRLTAQNLQNHTVGSTQGTFGQAGIRAGASGPSGAQYQGYHQDQGQAQMSYHTRSGRSVYPQHERGEASGHHESPRGETFQSPYGGHYYQGQYSAAQGQSQRSHGYAIDQYARQHQEQEPYGSDSNGRNRQAYLADFDRQMR